jgi:sulfate adenylyltransferase
MNKADALSVAKDMTTTSGLFWPTPVLNLVNDAAGIKAGDRIALKDPNVEGHPVLAVMDVEAVETFSDDDMAFISKNVYRAAAGEAHPGVDAFMSQGKVCLSGPIKVLNFSYFQSEFPDTFRTAVEIRNEIAERGWNKVVAFQTRNPMHLAHEELCHMAMKRLGCDGLVIHMLLGKLKKGDIPAPVRDAAIRKMVELYFPPNSAMVTGYGFDMLYAGPKEAVLHAVFRQNMGATHFIIGRDHAGVGDHYGAFDAQTIFDNEVPAGALDIEIFRADHTAWSKKLNKVVMMCEAPDHAKEDFVLLSGTKVREMLGNGIAPPKEFSRPEVAQILIKYYQGLDAA